MKHRRRTLIAPLCAAALFSLGTGSAIGDAADTEAWRFRVHLDDKPIGYHDFVVHRDADGEHVEIDAQFDVRILRIPVYSYRHTNSETWRDGCLTRLRSTTDDNGETVSVNAHQESGRVIIETGDGTRAIEDDCVQSFAYWNRDIVGKESLLNAQTGEMVPVTIRAVKPTPPAGRFDESRIDAYRILSDDGKVRIEIGYAREGGRWMYLESVLDNGRVLRYLPVDATASFGGARDGSRS